MWQKGDCCVCLFVCLPVCLFVLIFKIGLEGPRKMTYFVLELLGGFLHGDERGKSHKFRFLTGIRLTPCKWPQMPLNGFSTQFYFLILWLVSFLFRPFFFTTAWSFLSYTFFCILPLTAKWTVLSCTWHSILFQKVTPHIQWHDFIASIVSPKQQSPSCFSVLLELFGTCPWEWNAD